MARSATEESCESCQFRSTHKVIRIPGGDAYFCCIRAPVVEKGWPMVSPGAWCGEYLLREQSA